MANVRVATFGFTEVVLYPDLAPLYTIPAAIHMKTLLMCAITCAQQYTECAGFLFDGASSSPCQMVVHYNTTGASPTTSLSIYKIQTYRGKKVFEIESPDDAEKTFDNAEINCAAKGGKIIDQPITNAELAFIDIREKENIYIDLTDRDNDLVFHSQSGVEMDFSVAVWDDENPVADRQYCMGLFKRPMVYFDWFCDFGSSDFPYTVLCTEL